MDPIVAQALTQAAVQGLTAAIRYSQSQGATPEQLDQLVQSIVTSSRSNVQAANAAFDAAVSKRAGTSMTEAERDEKLASQFDAEATEQLK